MDGVPSTPMPDLPADIRGYVVTGVMQTPSDTDRFTAVEEGTRRRVVLRLLPALSEQERRRLESVLQSVATVAEDNLAEPVTLAEQADVLVLPTAEHTTLDQARASVTTAGQVATVVVPVADAAAALHRSGTAHGAITAAAVLIDRDGRPRLGHAGVQAALHDLAPGEIPAPTARDDVDAVLALLESLATEVDDDELSGLVADLKARPPDAAEISAALIARLTPQPLGDLGSGQQEVLTPSAEIGADTSGRRPGPAHRSRRTWLVVASVVVVVAGLVTAVALLVDAASDPNAAPSATAATTQTGTGTAQVAPGTDARTDVPGPVDLSAIGTPPAAQTPDPSPQVTAEVVEPPDGTLLCGAPGPAPEQAPELAEDWTTVIEELYTRRSAALVTGQASLLCDVYDPRSPGLESDLALDTAYVEQQVRPDTLLFVVEQANLVEQDGALLTIEITDRLEPYRLLNEAGDVVAELPGIESATWLARLVPDATGQQWRFG